MSKRNKKPSVAIHPTSNKSPRIGNIPREDGCIIFSFVRFDSQHHWCVEPDPKTHDVWELGEKLKSFEQTQWKHLAANQQNNHSVPFYKLVDEAQKVAQDMGIDDYGEIWSLRLTGKQRIWGVRDENFFITIWWDPHHQICPSLKT
jgi:hypothetical protein